MAMNKNYSEKNFFQEYVKLNAEQKKAVDAIEGPVMVAAGPGTGKTQIIALRVGKILKDAQVNPWNILTLTFTDAAAKNMRERLVKILGPSGYHIGVYTFHGFASEIVQTFPDYFTLFKETNPIDELKQLEIIEKIIDRLAKKLRPPRDPYHFAKDIASAISELKRENVTPERLVDLAENERRQIKSGQIKAEDVRRLDQLEKVTELSRIYQKYQNDLSQLGLYDFDDLLAELVLAIKNNPVVKGYLQEKYQYILVDEYQDTNNIQNEALFLMTDFYDQPNLFVVGDDKQSIFRFQGAALENMIQFISRFPKAKIIGLRQNYRSHQAILDAAHSLAGNNPDRLTAHVKNLFDELVSQTKNPKRKIDVQPFLNPADQAFGTAQAIKKIIDQKTAAAEIAVIYKHNKEAGEIAEVLNKLNIPYALEKGENSLDKPDIRRLIGYLFAGLNPNESEYLTLALQAPRFAVKSIDLFSAIKNRPKNKELLQHLNLSKKTGIKKAIETIAAWGKMSLEKSLPEFIELVLRESGLIKQILTGQNVIERLGDLEAFFEAAKKFSEDNKKSSLKDFLDYLSRMEKHNIEILPKKIDLMTSGVKLTTAHKVKGQEFDYVFIINLAFRHWGASQFAQKIKLPQSIAATQTTSDEKARRDADDRRLFYVALTRARRQVVLSYAKQNQAGRETLPSQFIEELVESNHARRLPMKNLNQFKRLKLLFGEESKKPLAGLLSEEKSWLKQLVVNQPIAPTGLDNYLNCPKEYLYKNLLRIPLAKTAPLSYGTAVHGALKEFFGAARKIGEWPGKKFIIEKFVNGLEKEFLNENDFLVFERLGEKVLSAWYQKFNRNLKPAAEVEYYFGNHNIHLGDIPITGVVDKIELIDGKSGACRVVDYKTGRAKTRTQITGENDFEGGNYFRQLVFYKLLGDLSPRFPYKIQEGTIAFIDDNMTFRQETFALTQKNVDDLKLLIKQLWQKMLALEFGVGEHKNYRKENRLCEILI